MTVPIPAISASMNVRVTIGEDIGVTDPTKPAIIRHYPESEYAWLEAPTRMGKLSGVYVKMPVCDLLEWADRVRAARAEL